MANRRSTRTALNQLLYLPLLLLTLFTSSGFAITSGTYESGLIITAGQNHYHSFYSNAGNSINLSISGDVSFWMELYDPTGKKIAQTTNLISRNSLTLTGTYTVKVRTYYASQTGAYRLYFTDSPGTVELGALENGGKRTDSLLAGDLNSYSFVADSGDSINLSVSGNKSFWMELYAPDGSNIAQTTNLISLNSLAQGGTYNVVIRSYYAHQTGTYDLHYTRTPGAEEFGELQSGTMRTGSITAGDLDSYYFDVDSGDSINLTVSGDIPYWMELYAPDGSNISQSSALISLNSLAQEGRYTLVIRSYYAHQTGDYKLQYSKAPGAVELGSLTEGANRTDTLISGDLNSYSFHADSGDSINLSASGDIPVWMELYAPDGTNIAQTSNLISLNSLAQTGEYTVVIRSYYNFQTGTYDLHYTRSPGNAEFNALTDGAIHTGALTAGDLDSYPFYATAGNKLTLSKTSGMQIWMEVYAPDGTNIAQSSGTINLNSLPQTGQYMLVIRSYYAHQTGDYGVLYDLDWF
ncbi:MAG: hypothetical protein D9N11_07360 [Ketobacter sp.]|nr:MAG: hypothetical protein D9N11_07360 [Ketobacter sp.]